MSTVLQKPVILDETGQAIVNKLGEIKDAIDSGGSEKYPVLIHITTPPTKTLYKVGEPIDYTGIVVKAVFSNNVEYDVTAQCSFVPAQGTPYAISEYPFQMEATATYVWHPTGTAFTASMVLPWNSVDRIRVATPPTKTVYDEGETLDLTGIVVKKVYLDDSEEVITNECVYAPANGDTLAPSDVEVTIQWTDTEHPFEPTYQTWQTITVNELPVYGVEWDGTSSSAWTRTDKAANFTDPVPYFTSTASTYGSPFDDISPWKDMTVVEDANAGTLVQIPKFYYKLTKEGSKLKIQISAQPVNGYLVSPAHADRGDGNGERDVVYVGKYHCISTYKSTTGADPEINHTRANFRNSIHNPGRYIWLWDFAMYMTLAMLYLVEFADWDAQRKIGTGYCGTAVTNGNSDGMPYHTGNKGYSADGFAATLYRNIENLWSARFDFVDGIYAAGTNYKDVYCIKNPSQFSDTTNGTLIGEKSINSGYDIKEFDISSVSGFEHALTVKELNTASNAGNTYICDLYSASTSNGSCLAVGGNSEQSGAYQRGLFFQSWVAANYSNYQFSARLMKLP